MDDLNTVADGESDQTADDLSVAGQAETTTTETGAEAFVSDEQLMERIRANPESAKIIGRELWAVRSRIDAAKAKLKRQIAA